jgi:putative lipoprotein
MGQEPGWQLEIPRGADMRFYDYGKGTAVMPAPRAVVDSELRRQTTTPWPRRPSHEIAPVKCSDAMSGKPFSATVTVTLNERSFRGCGEELAAPYTG